MKPNLVVGIDPSSSLTKSLYSIDAREPKLQVMLPEVVEIDRSRLSLYLSEKLSTVKPESEAWVSAGKRMHAVGDFAIDFGAVETLREAKSERTVPRVLALIGTIADREELPDEFLVNIGLLLPYGEYQGYRDKLNEELKKSLRNFQFRGRSLKVELIGCYIRPEGWGVYLENTPINSFDQQKLVLSMGFRNLSYFIANNGKLVDAESSNYGFSQFLKEFAKVIGQANTQNTLTWRELLAKARGMENSVGQSRRKIESLKINYWKEIENWLTSREFPGFHEIVITGGTGQYLKHEVEDYFKGESLNWCENLEKEARSLVGSNWRDEFGYRLTDLYGFYRYLEEKVRYGNLSCV
jgi:hypothetical protein